MKVVVLKVITPNGIIFNKEVRMVTVKTISGYRGILPNHAPLVSFLDLGMMRIHTESNGIIEYSTGNGLLIVKPDIIKILTDNITKKENSNV